ncbi:hypothetical protein L209DRAFT_516804 [Thermothelomyces heterothallicus CBS 203.75]
MKWNILTPWNSLQSRACAFEAQCAVVPGPADAATVDPASRCLACPEVTELRGCIICRSAQKSAAKDSIGQSRCVPKSKIR